MSLKSKSPAEFFAEHQNIAGFENAGKSLYTTIREFVENSLDAAEAISVLPEVEVTVEQLSTSAFNHLRGIVAREVVDSDLFEDSNANKKKSSKSKPKAKADAKNGISAGAGDAVADIVGDAVAVGGGEGDGDGDGIDDGDEKKAETTYFKITCKDNGMGMPHSKIPNMLGIVLSSTKYGLKQTRGKFGLGAKMALVWAKKSTGLPIEVLSSQGGKISYCKLDIDIFKNEPKVLVHEQKDNSSNWRGTEISVVIAGNWTSYRAKIVKYLRQLAVITPYAQLTFQYVVPSTGRSNKGFTLRFARRTDRMPPLPPQVKHHPSSVNNLLLESLINHAPNKSLVQFLSSELSSINKALAKRLIAELGEDFTAEMTVSSLSKQQIHLLTALLKKAVFDPPSSDCLSPAGEYNIRLGILKEINPDMVATHSEGCSVHDGHPFIVEAAVSIGGKLANPGVTVYRFANRIPLLFEAGSDVATVVANKKIKWSAYKINPKTDKIGVFVSIVSTQIPFKGTSKEYIGDDKASMHESVKHAIMQCCSQLRAKISRNQSLRSHLDRKRALSKYIPDVSRALMSVLNTMADPTIGSIEYGPHAKRRKLHHDENISGGDVEMQADSNGAQKQTLVGDQIVNEVKDGAINESVLATHLTKHIDEIDHQMAMEQASSSGKPISKEQMFVAPIDPTTFTSRSSSSTSTLELFHPQHSFRLNFFSQ